MSDRDALVCRAIVREHARTFHLASRFLPLQKRRAAFALYAFCRVADDIVDRADAADSVADLATTAAALAAHTSKLRDALAGRPSDPVFRELDCVMRQFSVPESVMRELLAGVAMDLTPVRYQSWSDLARYCEGVASSVGEMCTYVFGVQGDIDTRRQAVRYARTLGMAMQLTNILRDVGEDARHGRCYLPVDDLAGFGLTTEDILGGHLTATDSRWQGFMSAQVARARKLYAQASPGIALLSPDAQRCAWACAIGYSGILGALERIGFDSLSFRARLSRSERARVFWQVCRTSPQRRRLAPGGSRLHRPRDGSDAAQPEELVQLA
jgi:15-cis-phytoene synthase